jgi:hypothetical protein
VTSRATNPDIEGRRPHLSPVSVNTPWLLNLANRAVAFVEVFNQGGRCNLHKMRSHAPFARHEISNLPGRAGANAECLRANEAFMALRWLLHKGRRP